MTATQRAASLLLLLGTLACSHAIAATTLHVAQGDLQGTVSKGVETYLGIPYAAPPIGTNRWRMPQPASTWVGTRQATAFSASCQQSLSGAFGPWSVEYQVSGKVSEDCLYLNVWRPSAIRPEKLPIMVWIHGGGFSSGSGSVPIYDGAAMAAKGVVFINLNYRVGLFGFLAHPALVQESVGAGNYGLGDIVAALTWVRDNAAALGGDPEQVTIAGQSAGSMAIHDLMVSPAAKGLFARAISESGPGMGRPPASISKAQEVGLQLAKAAGVADIDQLRALPAQSLMEAEQKLGPGMLRFAPVIDGTFVPVDPYGSAAGTYIDTPILAGMNANEAFSLPADTVQELASDIDQLFGPMAPEARTLYRVSQASDLKTLDRLVRRERGIASTWNWSRQRAATSHNASYMYLFDHVQPGAGEWGSFHTSEVPYALATLDHAPGRAFTAIDTALSTQMSNYWINFVKHGDPNGDGLPPWERYDDMAPSMMVLGSRPHMAPMLTKEHRAFYQDVLNHGIALTLF
ncbi:para-nitrobenzyl esterase [Pseudoxanthomonas sp. GM95]|uniref:carboxylesterase/lipase family protein n=1 Tax=Pseudoxanthomonas sp. GM95 TaxID=1881043 RepID=UPI0008B628CC|nr:carboxylesterase family protein [Pseudoxanthomonas sp. GM95]SEM54188.1 para-nitrobenzyl esterase [Pseudoxanthomonas sp. GM95]